MENQIDLRNVALRYRVDIAKLVNKALTKGIHIDNLIMQANDFEKLDLIELMDDKAGITAYKHDDATARLRTVNADIARYEAELKASAEKEEVRETLSKLYSSRNSINRELSNLKYSGNGSIR